MWVKSEEQEKLRTCIILSSQNLVMQSVYENWGDPVDGGRRKKGERDLNQAGDERALLCASSCILDL